ncbi:MAG: SGNH/GDSL hydrolase family protein [Flavisolibacter sp.]
MQRQYTYIALGDSYTIGEAVPLHQNFPYQLVQSLRKKGFAFAAPEIIAKTGWSTDELAAALRKYTFSSNYDFATLLIGVNNQYRNREVIQFTMEFEALLEKAMQLTGNKKNKVAVLTIPDYSITPFAADLDKKKIAKEIDVYNAVVKAICLQYKIHCLNITESSRKAEKHPELLAADGLHPSAKEYAKWAKKLAGILAKTLK